MPWPTAYPESFRNWWMLQESYKIRLFSNDLFEALTKIAFEAWTARGDLVSDDNSKVSFEKVRDIISKKLGIREDRIELQSEFFGTLRADSLDAVELIMAFEDAFEIEINDEEASKVKTVADAMELLEKKVY